MHTFGVNNVLDTSTSCSATGTSQRDSVQLFTRNGETEENSVIIMHGMYLRRDICDPENKRKKFLKKYGKIETLFACKRAAPFLFPRYNNIIH